MSKKTWGTKTLPAQWIVAFGLKIQPKLEDSQARRSIFMGTFEIWRES